MKKSVVFCFYYFKGKNGTQISRIECVTVWTHTFAITVKP